MSDEELAEAIRRAPNTWRATDWYQCQMRWNSFEFMSQIDRVLAKLYPSVKDTKDEAEERP